MAERELKEGEELLGLGIERLLIRIYNRVHMICCLLNVQAKWALSDASNKNIPAEIREEVEELFEYMKLIEMNEDGDEEDGSAER